MTLAGAAQLWPALYVAASASDAYVSAGASGRTTAGALPPSSRLIRRVPARAATSRPARPLPVNATMSTGDSTSSRPVRRSPGSDWSTPSPRVRAACSASSSSVSGVVSAGFTTTVLPAASAGAQRQAAIISG